MVGSVDYNNIAIDGQVNVALRRRGSPARRSSRSPTWPPSSEAGSPATMIMDVPTHLRRDRTRPLNYDEKFRGPVSVRAGAGRTRSTSRPSRRCEFVGRRRDARRWPIGWASTACAIPQRYGLSVTLGGGEVTLLDLTYAYTPFANGGLQVGLPLAAAIATPASRQFEPVAILKIRRETAGALRAAASEPASRVVDAGLTYLITDILPTTTPAPTTYGRNSPLKLSRPAAAKTGTTDDFRDSWVVGYTPDLVTGVWVGNSDGSPMQRRAGARGAGAIWHQFMESRPGERAAATVPSPGRCQ